MVQYKVHVGGTVPVSVYHKVCVYQQVYRPMVHRVHRYHAVRGEISVDNHKVRLVWSSRVHLSPVYVPHVVQPKENVPYR